MKIRVVGGPVSGSVPIDVKNSDKFADIFKKIAKSVDHEELWSQYQLHTALLVEEDGARRVRPLPHIIQPDETPKALQLPQDGTAFVMLRPLGSTPPAMVPDRGSAVTGESVSHARNTHDAATANPNPTASYHDRLVAIYTKYQPEKLHTVGGTLRKFAGKEEAVIKQLVSKYGPEPPIEEALREAAAANTAVAAIAAMGVASGTDAATPSRATNLDMSSVRDPSTAPDRTPIVGESPAILTPVPSPRERDSSVMATPTPSPQQHGSSSSVGAAQVNPNPNPDASYADRLAAIYTKYEPEKVHLVAGTLRKFAGREDAVVRSLVKKYGPEPVIGVDVQLPKPGSDVAAPETSAAAAPEPPATVTVAAETPVVTRTPAVPQQQQQQQQQQQALAPTSPSSASSSPSSQPPPQSSPHRLSYRERLVAIYTKYHPEKLNTVEGNLRRFAGREEAMIQKLVQRYGPEPTDDVDEEATEARMPDEAPCATYEGVEQTDDKPVPVEVVKREDTSAAEYIGGNGMSPEVPPPPSVAATAVMSEPERAPTDTPSLVTTQQPAAVEPPAPQVSTTPLLSEAGGNTMDLGGDSGVRPISPTTPVVQVESIQETCSPTEPPVHIVVMPAEEKPAEAASTHTGPFTVTVTNPSPSSTGPAEVAVRQSPPPPPPPPPPQEVRQREAKRPWGAVGSKCATLLATQNTRGVARRYFDMWLRFRDGRKAKELIDAGLWEQKVGAASYQLVDDVKPPYVVGDLTAHVRDLRTPSAGAPRPFSDAMVLSLRAVVDGLRKCMRSQAIEITSEEERRMADDFLRQWESARELCPVRDGDLLAHALQQAARFLSQIEDLMSVTRSQDSQLGKLKEMHEQQAQHHTSSNEAMEAELKSLVDQLSESKKRQKALEVALEKAQASPRAATASVRTPRSRSAARTPSRGAVVSPRGGGPSSSAPTAGHQSPQSATEMRQEAQIVRLQQELAKMRSLVNRSKSFEEKLKQQLEESEERQLRLRRVVAATATAETAARRGSSSRNGTARGRPSRTVSAGGRSRSNLPQHASFSQPQVSPRRSNGGVSPYRANEATVLDHDEHAAAAAVPSSDAANREATSPWPKSRYVPPVPEIDRGPCPNCLTPLTSISPDMMGPAEERAAFCFSCRRSFTFGELAHRDGAGASWGLSELWNSR